MIAANEILIIKIKMLTFPLLDSKLYIFFLSDKCHTVGSARWKFNKRLSQYEYNYYLLFSPYGTQIASNVMGGGMGRKHVSFL